MATEHSALAELAKFVDDNIAGTTNRSGSKKEQAEVDIIHATLRVMAVEIAKLRRVIGEVAP